LSSFQTIKDLKEGDKLHRKWPTATSYHPSLRLGMKGVKEDQQIEGIAGFSMKGDIYFFMLDLDITNVEVCGCFAQRWCAYLFTHVHLL